MFLTRTYHVERTGPIDLMTRVSSVGEFFKIVKGSATIDYRTGYTSALSDTRIYDEVSPSFVCKANKTDKPHRTATAATR